ncbi:MAG: LPD7 domain-containing protein, partial [Acidithiobacillus sp.]
VQSAMRERADIQLRWNDRCRMHAQAEKERQARQAAVLLAQRQDAARLAAIEAERETRRQKLLELAELIRSDREAKANLRQAYAAAGYRLEERDGKSVWVYPHGDLQAEKGAAYAARQAWNARKAALKAQRLEQDRATEQETRPGIRHPQRSTWQAWRAQTLTRKYNPAYSAEMAERDIYCRWMPEDGGLYLRLGKAEVIDQGPLLLAKNGTGDIPLMIETAQAKGWASLEFTGDAAFQEQAAMAALRAGLNVADADLARRAADALEVQDRQGKLRALAETLRADVDTKMDVRKAYLAAGYVVEPREGGAVLVYPPGDLPEARKAVTEARKDWNERAGRSRAQPERREPKAQISAYGAEYARRDGWKGTFTGAVIAVDEGHVYVGAKGGGVAPHCIAIPKERFKTLPSKGLYATFTPGDAQRPAGWSKVLGRMNGQGRLVRDQGKGQGIGD